MKEEFVTIKLWCLLTVSYRGSSDMTVSDLQCKCGHECHVQGNIAERKYGLIKYGFG